MNKLRAGVKVVAVKAPGFGENRKANLQDIAVLTGERGGGWEGAVPPVWWWGPGAGIPCLASLDHHKVLYAAYGGCAGWLQAYG